MPVRPTIAKNMFRVIILTLAALAATISSSDDVRDIEEIEGLLILHKSNLERALKENEFIVVEFYAPWCPHCRLFAPEYAKAAALLKEDDSPIRLAKIDATEDPNFAKEQGIDQFPTVKFFRKGDPIDYKGSRRASDLVRWLKKNSGPPAVELKTKDEADALKDIDDIVVFGFFKNQKSKEAEEYLKVALAIEDLRFGITSEKEVFDHYKVKKDGVVLFKKFDEGRNDLEGEINESNIEQFITLNRLPLVFEFGKDTSGHVFSSSVRTHIILFLEKVSGDDVIKVFRETVKDFKHKFLFMYVDAKNEDNSRLLDYFGVKESDIPTLRLINLHDGTANKYWPKSEGASADAIKNFIKDFQGGKLLPQLMSEDIPEDWDSKPVKVLVGKNFKEVAFNKDKAVFVKFYAPWCKHSQQLAPTWEKLAEAYKDKENIVIAKIDATHNEVENVSLEGFPTLVYIPRGSDQVIDYNGAKTLKAFKKFLDSDGKDQVQDEEKDKEEKDEEKGKEGQKESSEEKGTGKEDESETGDKAKDKEVEEESIDNDEEEKATTEKDEAAEEVTEEEKEATEQDNDEDEEAHERNREEL